MMSKFSFVYTFSLRHFLAKLIHTSQLSSWIDGDLQFLKSLSISLSLSVSLTSMPAHMHACTHTHLQTGIHVHIKYIYSHTSVHRVPMTQIMKAPFAENLVLPLTDCLHNFGLPAPPRVPFVLQCKDYDFFIFLYECFSCDFTNFILS